MTTTRYLQFGDIITARFPEQNPQGHEQEGYRPAIVIGFPSRLGIARFELIVLIPMTSDRGQQWANSSPDLYLRFAEGIAGLKSPSIALLDQLRVLDANRIVAYRGSLTPEQYEPILTGLGRMIRLVLDFRDWANRIRYYTNKVQMVCGLMHPYTMPLSLNTMRL